MTRESGIWVFLLIVGCGRSVPPPAVLRQTEFKDRVVVEHADPVDPESFLYTLRGDGQIVRKGQVLTGEEIVAQTSRPPGEPNRTPILFEVEPKTGFAVVRDALAIFTGKPSCVNYAFLATTRNGPGAVVLPMQSDMCSGIHLYEGRSDEKVIGSDRNRKQLELVVSAAERGEIEIAAINFMVPSMEPAIYFPEAGEKPGLAPRSSEGSWAGKHPPCGRWTLEALRTFLGREDIAALSPYVRLKITNKEEVADVVRCLSSLRSLGGIAIVPDIPSGK